MQLNITLIAKKLKRDTKEKTDYVSCISKPPFHNVKSAALAVWTCLEYEKMVKKKNGGGDATLKFPAPICHDVIDSDGIYYDVHSFWLVKIVHCHIRAARDLT